MSHGYRVTITHNIPIECNTASLLQSGNINCYWKAYTAGLRKYNTFCREINQPSIPVFEDTLLLLVTNLAQQDLPYAMI